MSNAASNSPGITELVNLSIDRYMMEVHTCAPGRVVSYDLATQTATVQPCLKRVITGQEPIDLPQILKVPVVFPSTAGAWLRLPVAVGDYVMLHFSERSLDRWMVNGGLVDPEIPHKFSLADAIATPGLRPVPAEFTPKGAETSVELANGPAWIEVTAAGKFRIKNAGADLLTVLDDLLGAVLALSTTNAVVGAPCALGPASVLQVTNVRLALALLRP